jgi:hypothetical protein
MVYGVCVSHSLMLSEIGRALREDADLLYTEKRLSRNLNTDRLDDKALLQRHLERASVLTKANDGEGVVIAVDYTDLSKPRANLDPHRGMEGVCMCYDGSKGKPGPGYPMVQLEAHFPDGNQRPLIYRPFTYGLGFSSQQREFLDAIREAAQYVGPKAWWVMDRGFDGKSIFAGTEAVGARWICRVNLAKHRTVYQGQTKMPVDLAVAQMRPQYRHVLKGTPPVRVRIASRVVQLENRKGKREAVDRTLVAVWFPHSVEPMTLLASEYVPGRAGALEVADAYSRRWKCEEATRSMKDSRQWGVRIEDLRALRFRGVERLVLVALLAYGILSDLRAACQRLARVALAAVKTFGTPPVDLRYRLLRGVGSVLAGIQTRARLRARSAT